MKSIEGTQTELNLLKAFAGESQAKNRYEFFARIAKKEGYEQVAAIFEETAKEEQTHAKVFFKFLEGRPLEITATYPAGKIGDTIENLDAAAKGENEEWTEIYPQFASIADDEGFRQIALKFRLISKIESEHASRFMKLLKTVETEKVFERPTEVSWVCRKCGYVHFAKKALETCPVCEHPQAYFQIQADNY